MKIAHYYPYTFAGIQGAANAVRGMGSAQGRQGHDITFFVDDAIPQGITPAPGQRVVRLKHSLRGRARIPVGLSAIARGNFDIVCVHSAWVPGKAVAAIAAHRGGARVVVSPHGGLHPRVVARHRGRKWLYWLAVEQPHLKRADAIHVLFRDEVAYLDRLGLRSRVLVAPNGVDSEHETVWDGGSASVLVWLGRYDIECKGLDILVHAIHAMPVNDRPRLRLFGPDFRGGRAILSGLVGRLGLEKWIEANGPVYGDEKLDVLATASGFVYPSRWEAGGISALEAMSLGVPAVLTDFPLGTYMRDRGAAFVAVPEPAALAEQIQRVFTTEAHDVAKRGSTIVRAEFNWDAIANSWLTQARQQLG